MSYSSEVLNALITSNGCTMVGTLPDLKKEAKLVFLCKCGKEDTKTFVRAKISGLLCKSCTQVSRSEKRETTNLKKYGTKCTLQAEEVLEKSEKTLVKRFGCTNAFSSKEIKEKIKKTNLEKYGAENPFASNIIIDALRKKCKEKYGSEYPMQNAAVVEKVKTTNMAKYGVEVSSKAASVKQKACETNMLLYGCEHHSVPEILEKGKMTNLIKYGVEYTFQAEAVKDKIKETMVSRYGVEHNMQSPIIQASVRETNQRNRGTSYPMQSPEVRAKSVATNMLRYGVPNVNQSSEVQAKSQMTGLAYKLYTTPLGDERKIQGYEHFALDLLFKKFEETDVFTARKDVPRICYDNESKYYFPDIYVKSINKIIEVKSTWTYTLHLQTNTKKWQETTKCGYTMEFWIFDNKGNLTIVCDPTDQ